MFQARHKSSSRGKAIHNFQDCSRLPSSLDEQLGQFVSNLQLFPSMSCSIFDVRCPITSNPAIDYPTPIHHHNLKKMPCAGCVFLQRKTVSCFKLNNPHHPGTMYHIAGAQIDDFMTYNKMICAGHKRLAIPLGYNKFAEIFNLAPGLSTQFAYIPEGQDTLIGSRPGPNRHEFHVAPNNLYHACQVALHGSQVLLPS